jgi:hypothetical protein
VRTTRVKAVQVHPVPSSVTNPSGPFPRELFREPKIITEYDSELPEDGSDFPTGSTAQNNFKPTRVMICSQCNDRVLETKTGDHVCRD